MMKGNVCDTNVGVWVYLIYLIEKHLYFLFLIVKLKLGGCTEVCMVMALILINVAFRASGE